MGFAQPCGLVRSFTSIVPETHSKTTLVVVANPAGAHQSGPSQTGRPFLLVRTDDCYYNVARQLSWRSPVRPYTKSFLAAVVILTSVGLYAQEASHPENADFLARLSYDSSATGGGMKVQRICVAVSVGGDYRIVRLLDSGLTQRLQGKIPPEQFQQLRSALLSAEFRRLSGSHSGLIRQESESFAAEVPVPGWHGGVDKTQRLQWLNADGDNPFPSSVARVINWLENFEPKDGKPFVYTEFPDVCPSVGVHLLQPSVAANLNH